MLDILKLDVFQDKLKVLKKNQKSIKYSIEIENIQLEITKKKIKNINLRICHPEGQVRISAPLNSSQERIIKFVISKLEWIKKQKSQIQNHPARKPERFLDNEIHYFRGQPYKLKILINNREMFVKLIDQQIILNLPRNSGTEKKRFVLNDWYYEQLKSLIPPLIEKWEKILNVNVSSFHIRTMKTRWGSCTPKTRRVRFNLELAKSPPETLEYIVVHELVHLIEPSHNNRFKSLMDRFYPNWRICKKNLYSYEIN